MLHHRSIIGSRGKRKRETSLHRPDVVVDFHRSCVRLSRVLLDEGERDRQAIESFRRFHGPSIYRSRADDECVEAKRGPDASHARANVKRYVHSSKLPTRRDPTNLRIYTIRPVSVFDSICPLPPRKQARSTATDFSYLPRTACRCDGTATRVPLTPKRGNARLFRSNNTVQLPRIISSLLAIRRYPLSLFYENAIDSIPFTLEIVNARQWKCPVKRGKQRDFSIREYDFDIVRSWLLVCEQRRFGRKQSGPPGSSDRLTLRRQTSKRS